MRGFPHRFRPARTEGTACSGPRRAMRAARHEEFRGFGEVVISTWDNLRVVQGLFADDLWPKTYPKHTRNMSIFNDLFTF